MQQNDFVSSLAQSLAASLSSEQNLRKQAEDFILQASSQPGYASALLDISGDTSQDASINHAAAVQLGTLVEFHWKFYSEEQAKNVTVTGFKYIILVESDKQYVRSKIIERLFNCQNRMVAKQFTRCLMTMCKLDYPEKWESLFSQDIPNALNSQNDKGILTGLQALQCLTKKFEFELDEARDPLYNIM